MLLYAHRGAHQTHPENTLEAFEAAIAQGHTSPRIEQEYEEVKRKAGG